MVTNLLNKLEVEYNILINEEDNLLVEQKNQKENIIYIETEILNDSKIFNELKHESDELSKEINKLNANNDKSTLHKINESLSIIT